MPRIVIAFDGSPSARTAIVRAAELFSGAEATVLVVAPGMGALREAAGAGAAAARRRGGRGGRVAGRRGRGATASAVLGSVSASLLHAADRPLLIANA